MFYVYSIGGNSSLYESGSLKRLQRSSRSKTQAISPTSSVSARGTPVVSEDSNDFEHSETQTQVSSYTKVLEERREKAFFVEDVMTTALRTVPSDASVAVVWQLIRRERFRHVPVVNKSRLVGIVSDRDILPLVSDDDLMTKKKQSIQIAELMSSPVLTVRPKTKIRVAAKVLLDEHVGALPVVDEDDALVGMLTRTDILRAVVSHAPLEIWV